MNAGNDHLPTRARCTPNPPPALFPNKLLQDTAPKSFRARWSLRQIGWKKLQNFYMMPPVSSRCMKNLISTWTQTRPCPLELELEPLSTIAASGSTAWGFCVIWYHISDMPPKSIRGVVPLWVCLSYEGNICELTISSMSKNLGRWWCDGQDRAKVGKKTRENG